VSSLYEGIQPARSQRGELLTYRAPDASGFRLTRLYARFPFSVRVVAPTKQLRELALAELVETRPVTDISVRRTPAS